MARLNARWFNFVERGQKWWHYWQDAGSLSRTLSDTTSTSDSLVRAAILFSRTNSDTLATLTDTVVHGKVRISQLPVEVVARPTSTLIRASQLPVEVVARPTSTKIRASQLPVEAIVKPTSTLIRASQVVVEVVVFVITGGTFTADAVIGPKQRTLSDTLTTSDSLTRAAATKLRTLSDTLTISESVTRSVLKPRTLTDTLTTSDSLVRAAAVKTRTLSDTLTISESVTQQSGKLRTLSDTLTISDSLVRAAATRSRTLSDTLTISESVSRTVLKPRTLTDTLTISDSLSAKSIRTKTFTADAVINAGTPHTGSFTADAVIFSTSKTFTANAVLKANSGGLSFTASAIMSGGGGGTYWGGSGPGGGGSGGSGSPPPHPKSRIKITLDGIDITPRVKYATASFVSTVNGTPGTCSFEIVDLAHSVLPVTGKRVDLYIDNFLYWAGYATRAVRIYGFPVDVTTNANKTERLFRIEGVDVNILFQKRVVYNKTTPSKGQLPPPVAYRCSATLSDEWASNTQADVVVPYLLSHYTDLPADGVTFNVSSNFGSPEPDRCFAFTGAMTVGSLMTDLNRLLQGVWYIDQNFVFHFHDTETTTSLYTLVDDPEKYGNVPTNVAPRELLFLSDGSRMVNDAMVWGTAQGYKKVTFDRVIDNNNSNGVSSVTDHGLWQYGEFNTSVYKQATVNKIANSIVFGVTQNQQGARWDRVVVTATVYQPLFQLGDVVHCISDAYNGPLASPYDAPFGNKISTGPMSINLPIRRIEVTFPTPDHAKFQLTLSREIDDPFNAFEFIFPHIGGINLPPPFDFPPIVLPPIDCGITDTWDRTLAQTNSPPAGWGVASSGFTWNGFGTVIVGGFSVDGDWGVMTNTPQFAEEGSHEMTLAWAPIAWPVGVLAGTVTAQSNLSHGSPPWNIVETYSIQFNGVKVSFFFNSADTGNGWGVFSDDPAGFGTTSATASFSPLVEHKVEFAIVNIPNQNSQFQVYCYPTSGPRPSTPSIIQLLSAGTFATSTSVTISGIAGYFGSVGSTKFNNLNILGVNGCTNVGIDEFSRLVAPTALGVADAGFTWAVDYFQGGGATATLEVDGTQALASFPGGQNDQFTSAAALLPVISGEFDFSVTCRFGVSSVADHDNETYIAFKGDLGWNVFITNTNDSVTGGFSVRNGSLFTPKNDWAPGYYQIRYSINNGYEELTLWRDGTPEPDVQARGSKPSPNFTVPWNLTIDQQYVGGATTPYTAFVDWIRVEAGTHPETLPPNSFGCSQIYPVGTVASLGQSFMAGSERVYLNGLLQRYGTDYTTEPANGRVIFTVAPVPTDLVYICFGSAQ